MKNIRIYFFILFILIIFCQSCEKFSEHDKYKRPEWLPGKLYTTIETYDNLSMFAECLRLSQLDTILDVSGSWSVFAPTNEAIKQYLQEHQYAGISDLPKQKLEKLTEFHVIQNPWSFEQLKELSFNGWREGENGDWRSYAYKRQTILKNDNEKYWTHKENRKEIIVSDSTLSNGAKKVYVGSRKYVPIFYDEFLQVNGITPGDYSFYFDRTYEPGNVYYAGAKILQSDILAENGFVHIIDKVVEPMLNAKEIMERELPGESYKLFLDLIYGYYPDFETNMIATFNQPEVRRGGLVDTLWDLDYSGLAFAIHSERTGYEGSGTNESLVRHNGMLAPTDDVFSEFIEGTLTIKSGYPHWVDIYSLPVDVVDIIVPQYLRSSAIYPSKSIFQDVFSGNGNFKLNEGDIIRKEFGSNCTFIGVNNYVPNKVFTSVTGPVFCRPAFSTFRRAMIYSGVYETIANYDGELYFFPIPDNALVPDSSLMINWINRDNNQYSFSEVNRQHRQIMSLNSYTIRNRILNQVGTTMPNGSANKEFIRTLRGNYITWDHTNNTIQGSRPCTIGYNGVETTTCYTTPLDEPADNGKTWSVRYWFNFGSSNMQTALSEYEVFYNLLKKVGLVNEGSSDISFLDKNKNYTVFVPSDAALADFDTRLLSKNELRAILKKHFLEGAIIFTDNKQGSGNYNTSSGENINIQTAPDMIEIINRKGKPYVFIPEEEGITNIMVSEGSEVKSVIHQIDKVIIE